MATYLRRLQRAWDRSDATTRAFFVAGMPLYILFMVVVVIAAIVLSPIIGLFVVLDAMQDYAEAHLPPPSAGA